MKINELMVGDWVICKHYQDKPFTKQFGVADFAKGEYEFCEPIPITEEILVKNGFELCYDAEQQPFYRCKEDWYIGLWLSSDGFDYDLTIEVHYVHQLQHLLRLVGVQKEIEL